MLTILQLLTPLFPYLLALAGGWVYLKTRDKKVEKELELRQLEKKNEILKRISSISKPSANELSTRLQGGTF